VLKADRDFLQTSEIIVAKFTQLFAYGNRTTDNFFYIEFARRRIVCAREIILVFVLHLFERE
jgi:hypothetical protein